MNNNEKMSASRLHSSGNQHGIKFFMIVFLTIFISLLSACATTPIPDPEPEPEPDPIDIVVEFPGDHLKEPVGTVTIGNETIDLVKLKKDKGDFYRFYEPLTEQEIKDMHKIISEYEKKGDLVATKVWLSSYGYDKNALSQSEFDSMLNLELEIGEKYGLIFEGIYENTLPGLEKYKRIIIKTKDSDGNTHYNLPDPSKRVFDLEDPLQIEFMVRANNMRWDL